MGLSSEEICNMQRDEASDTREEALSVTGHIVEANDDGLMAPSRTRRFMTMTRGP